MDYMAGLWGKYNNSLLCYIISFRIAWLHLKNPGISQMYSVNGDCQILNRLVDSPWQSAEPVSDTQT